MTSEPPGQAGCGINLKGNIVDDKEAGLDRLLGELAAQYELQQPGAGARERLKRRLQAESRRLSDNDLDWLAAAGTPGEAAPKLPDDDAS